MKEFCEGKGAAPVRFFHICTDGTDNGVIHFDDEDYLRAISISAINAYKHGVDILCYCHMSTHSHFVASAISKEHAGHFADAHKHDYSRYMQGRRGIRNILGGVDCNIKEITDPWYLKRCIAYVLMNPVAAGIVKVPEEYKWSSMSAYFNPADDGVARISSLKVRMRRNLLHTKTDLGGSSLMMTSTGRISMKSFVRYQTVERLFGSQTALFKSLALTNSATEEDLYVSHKTKYDDTELIAEIISFSIKTYGKSEFRMLTKAEKHSIIPFIFKKTGATPKRIARLLRIPVEEVSAMLGK